MRLDVPLVRQPYNSVWCGPACAEMVLRWHGIKIRQKQIAAEIPIIKGGVKIARLGQYFVSKGLETTIQFWSSSFGPKFRGLRGGCDSPKVMQALEWGIKKCGWPTKQLCSEVRAFVNRGGKVVLAPPDFSSIKREITKKRPVILLIEMKTLCDIGLARGHYVVASGCTDTDSQTTKDYFDVNDPGTGKKLFVPSDKLLAACKANLNCVIFVRPRV